MVGVQEGRPRDGKGIEQADAVIRNVIPKVLEADVKGGRYAKFSRQHAGVEDTAVGHGRDDDLDAARHGCSRDAVAAQGSREHWRDRDVGLDRSRER